MRTKKENNYSYKIYNNPPAIIEYSEDKSYFIFASYSIFKKKWNTKIGLTKNCYNRMNHYLQKHIEDLI